MVTESLFAINTVLFLVLSALLLSLFYKNKRQKKFQEQQIDSLQGMESIHWFRINVARPVYYARWIKLLGFEAKGILVINEDDIRIVARVSENELIDRNYKKNDLSLKWLGNQDLKSSNLHWFSIGSDNEKLILSADTGFNAISSREASADLYRKIAPDIELPALARADFALEKNPASLAAVVLFFSLLAFSIVDGMIINENEIVDYGKIFVGTFVLPFFAIPSYWFLTYKAVPSRESLALSTLLIFALMLAFLPIVKRIDQWLSPKGFMDYPYIKMGEETRFKPELEELPTLSFRQHEDFWNQYDEDAKIYFSLSSGPLGIWQINRTKLNEKIKKFYQE